MVHLLNIIQSGNEISCDYDPESSGKKGHIVVDVNSYEITEIDFSNYEYGKKMYASRVRAKLEELLNASDDIPKEAVSIWY